MVFKNYPIYEYGNTVYFECTFLDLTFNKTDPVSPEYQIKNERGQIIDSGTLTKKEKGVYYVFWTPNQEGLLEIVFSGTIEGQTVKMREKFEVKRTSWKGENFS